MDRPHRRLAGVLAPVAALALIGGSAGCYLVRQGAGQAAVLLGRRPVAEVLHDPATPAGVRRRLRALWAARRFGVERLGLAGATLYRDFYDPGSDPDGAARPAAWNVSACAKDRFEARTWWFPVVGEAPYLGFFDAAEAEAAAAALRDAEDLDVLLRPVAAYSTLGWFDDPVFGSALRGDAFDIAELTLHEMAHATVFLPGQGDFNESLATLVGERGALAFLADRYGPGSAQVERARGRLSAEAEAARHIDAVVAELEALYARPDLSRPDKLRLREEVFARGKAALPRTPAADGWRAARWDNALLMNWRRYHGDERGLASLLDGRFGGDLAAFVAWTRTLDAPPGSRGLPRLRRRPGRRG